jgi:hypothetical protein
MSNSSVDNASHTIILSPTLKFRSSLTLINNSSIRVSKPSELKIKQAEDEDIINYNIWLNNKLS